MFLNNLYKYLLLFFNVFIYFENVKIYKNYNKNNVLKNIILGEIDELNLTTDRLLKRCKAVDVIINTPRNDDQVRAIAEVNILIDDEVLKMRDNIKAGKNVKNFIKLFLISVF